MNFELSDDLRLVRDSLSGLLRDTFDFDTRQKASASPAGYSKELWQAMAELGLLALAFGPDHGGLDEPGAVSVVMEDLGRSLAGEPFLPCAVVAGSLLLEVGKPQWRDQLIADIISGKELVSLAHAEPRSRYDVCHVEATAAFEPDKIVLNGHKAVVPFGGQASRWIVSARDQNDGALQLLLVDADADGVTMNDYPTTDGGRAAELVFANTVVPLDKVLDQTGNANNSLETAIAHGIAAVSAEAVGLMDAVCSQTLDYLKTRKQFGRPIGSFQVLQHAMVDMYQELEQARSMAFLAADAPAKPSGEREADASAAKAAIGQGARKVAEAAIQLHGGIGMTWETPLAHYAKRLIAIDHLFGDTDYHLERFARLNYSGKP